MATKQMLILIDELKSAIEKDYPKQPNHVGTATTPDLECPTCGVVISKYQRYCMYCGQKLEWEAD